MLSVLSLSTQIDRIYEIESLIKDTFSDALILVCAISIFSIYAEDNAVTASKSFSDYYAYENVIRFLSSDATNRKLRSKFETKRNNYFLPLLPDHRGTLDQKIGR